MIKESKFYEDFMNINANYHGEPNGILTINVSIVEFTKCSSYFVDMHIDNAYSISFPMGWGAYLFSMCFPNFLVSS